MIKIELSNNPGFDFDSKNRPYCYSSVWYDLYRRVFNYNLKKYIIIDGKDIIGEFGYVLLKSKMFGNRIISMPFSDEGGIHLFAYSGLDSSSKREILNLVVKLIDSEALDHTLTYAEIRGGSDFLLEYGRKAFLQKAPYVKFVLNTDRDYSRVRCGYNSNIIKNLRKADKHVDVCECDSLDGIDYVYSIYLEQMKKFGSPPLPQGYFSELFKVGFSKILLAKVNNKVAGFLMNFIFKNKMYADINASLSKFDTFFPKVRLFDASIRWACSNGIKTYDLMRTRRDSGVYWHKKKWGGSEEAIYYYYRKFNRRANLTLDPYQKRYFIPRFIFKNMPSVLLRNIGGAIRTKAGK